MRKIAKIVKAVAITLGIGIVASCSSLTAPSPDEVMEKIQSGEKLEMADYETMLDYLEEFVEVGEDSPNDAESGREVGMAYPYFVQFASRLDFAPKEMKEDSRYQNVTRRFRMLMNR